MPPRKVRPGAAYRAFFDALLWMVHTGWIVDCHHYAYRCKKCHFERVFQGVQVPDMQEEVVDSACCRVHQSSAGAGKSSGPQAIGITRGGLNTKIHAVCDALGNPLRFALTTWQRHDSQPVPEQLYGLAGQGAVG